MDKANNVRRFLVVTRNVVVGEDLREILEDFARAEVDVISDLSAVNIDAKLIRNQNGSDEHLSRNISCQHDKTPYTPL